MNTLFVAGRSIGFRVSDDLDFPTKTTRFTAFPDCRALYNRGAYSEVLNSLNISNLFLNRHSNEPRSQHAKPAEPIRKSLKGSDELQYVFGYTLDSG